jgi:hypothetical protein
MLVYPGYDIIDFHVWMCLYTCILQSSGIFVCLYNHAMSSHIFMLRYACMLVFPEVVKYLYMHIAEHYVNVW